MLYFKGETIPHLSVLTAVQYQHPQQWQDDKASMLIMDSANMVVVLKGSEPTVHCHILWGLSHKWNVPKGILEHYNLSFAEISPTCFLRDNWYGFISKCALGSTFCHPPVSRANYSVINVLIIISKLQRILYQHMVDNTELLKIVYGNVDKEK